MWFWCTDWSYPKILEYRHIWIPKLLDCLLDPVCRDQFTLIISKWRFIATTDNLRNTNIFIHLDRLRTRCIRQILKEMKNFNLRTEQKNNEKHAKTQPKALNLDPLVHVCGTKRISRISIDVLFIPIHRSKYIVVKRSIP